MAAHASSTSASSGAQSASGSEPRPNRLTSLSSRYGEKVASTQCSQRTASPREPSPCGWPTDAGTSKETTVPITCSACLRRPGPASVPAPVMRGSGALVQRALQRLDVARAGVGGAGHRVDLAVLRRQRLTDQLGEGELADLDVVQGVGRLHEDRDLDDLAAPLDQLDPDRAVGGAGHLAVDGGLARRQVLGYRPLRERPGDDFGLPAAGG